MALLECKNLTLSYDNKPVVENVSFTLEEGSYFCIVGENGSGKSTLIKAILGLKKPVSGSIEFGENLSQTEIGFIPQYSDIQRDFPASVKEVVLSGCLNSCGFLPFYGKAQIKKANYTMELLGITDIAKKSFKNLSGGQRQRVLLARALCATNKVLLLDEPLGALDLKLRKDMQQELKKIQKATGITFIFVTHDPYVALLTEKRIIMKGGAVEKILTPGDEERNALTQIAKMDADMMRLRERIRSGELLSARRIEA